MAHGRKELAEDFNNHQTFIQKRLQNSRLSHLSTHHSSMALTFTDVDIHVELNSGSTTFCQELHGDASVNCNDILSIELFNSGSLALQERFDGHFKPHLSLDLPSIDLNLHIHSTQTHAEFHQPVDARIKSDNRHLNIVLQGSDCSLFSKSGQPSVSQQNPTVKPR